MLRVVSFVLFFWLALSCQLAHAWEQTGTYRFDDVERLVFVGDIHGAYSEFHGLLVKTGLIDGQSNWSGGSSHLVSVGDMLDRGDRSRAVMDLMIHLQAQAEAAGGRVHVLLGNHEVMNLTGELAYVTDGEFASYADLVPADVQPDASRPAGYLGHRFAFSPEGPYGQWLLKRPFTIVVNDIMFLHGGLSKKLNDLDLDTINSRAHQQLQSFLSARRQMLDAGVLKPDSKFFAAQKLAQSLSEDPSVDESLRAAASDYSLSSKGLPFDAKGPVWYRRTAVCHPYDEHVVNDAIQDALGVRRVVIGHTPTIGRTVQSRMDDRVLLVDTGMNVGYYKGHPSAVVIEGDRERVVYSDLETTTIERQSNRMWKRPYGMSDEQIEAFLRDADIVNVEDLETGVTHPQRLDLKLGDRRMRAAFKDYDTDPGLETSKHWSRLADKADRYQYEVAAYKLDRLLGLEMVPPAILRQVNGKKGVLVYWIEGAILERDRRDNDISYTGECAPSSQFNLMNVFDALIHNDDRNLTNVLYTRSDWTLWLIDHSRAFRSHRKLPEFLRRNEFDLTPKLRQMLGRLDRDYLAPLEPYLHKNQINGIVLRARRLLRD
jgi:hypothetical protein